MRSLIILRPWRCISNVYDKRFIASSRCCLKNAENISLYDTLGVEKNASRQEIRDAYLGKTKLYHPDRNPDDASLHAKFVEVNEAYSILGDRVKRREYDSISNRPSAYSYRRRNASGNNPFGDDYTVQWEWTEEDKKRMYEELHRYYQDQGVAYREELANRSRRNGKLLLRLFVIVVVCNIAICFVIWDAYKKYTEVIERKSQENAEILRNPQSGLSTFLRDYRKSESEE